MSTLGAGLVLGLFLGLHCFCCGWHWCWCCIVFTFCDSVTAPCCPASITLPWGLDLPVHIYRHAIACPTFADSHRVLFIFLFLFLFWRAARFQKRAHLRLGFGNLARVWFVFALVFRRGRVQRVSLAGVRESG